MRLSTNPRKYDYNIYVFILTAMNAALTSK